MNNFKDRKIDYSYKSLSRTTKDELIAMVWQHRDYIEKLDKALDKAVELLDLHMDCEKCPFPLNYEKCTIENCKEYLKEMLLKGDEE